MRGRARRSSKKETTRMDFDSVLAALPLFARYRSAAGALGRVPEIEQGRSRASIAVAFCCWARTVYRVSPSLTAFVVAGTRARRTTGGPCPSKNGPELAADASLISAASKAWVFLSPGYRIGGGLGQPRPPRSRQGRLRDGAGRSRAERGAGQEASPRATARRMETVLWCLQSGRWWLSRRCWPCNWPSLPGRETVLRERGGASASYGSSTGNPRHKLGWPNPAGTVEMAHYRTRCGFTPENLVDNQGAASVMQKRGGA
jgi:hypothetical protein